MMILSPRLCSRRGADRGAGDDERRAAVEPSPSPTIRTSPNSIVAPGSPAKLLDGDHVILATRYCFPPVRITAYMGSKTFMLNASGRDPPSRSAHYSGGDFCCQLPGGPALAEEREHRLRDVAPVNNREIQASGGTPTA